MSNYNDFISDFPQRCGEILSQHEYFARLRGREVTLLLSIASVSILVPYERLARPHREGFAHPSGDRIRFRPAQEQFDKLLEATFIQSPLWNNTIPHSWKYEESVEVSHEPDFWPELRNPRSLSNNKQVRSVVKHIRNALAHGNIFTRGWPRIDTIIFLSQASRDTYRFNLLSVSPNDFRSFLTKWIQFLESIKMPRHIVPEHIETAA